MSNQGSRFRNLIHLIAPSPMSGVLCVFLASLPLILFQFKEVREYLRLPDNLQVFQAIVNAADKALNSTLGQSRTDVVVVGAFWALVGLGVYMFLRGLAQYMTELDDSITVRKYVWPKGANRARPFFVMLERTAFRLVALIGLALIFFGPLAHTFKGPIFVDFIGPNVPIQYVTWFLAGVLLWHAVVVLLRLSLLRIRVVGEA